MDSKCILCNDFDKFTIFKPLCGHCVCIKCFFQEQNIYCKYCKKKYDFGLLLLLRMYMKNT